MRGKHSVKGYQASRPRNIPAYAGKTPNVTPFGPLARNIPAYAGKTPNVTPFGPLARNIPEYAGKTVAI